MTKCKQVIDWDNNINILESDVIQKTIEAIPRQDFYILG